MMDVYIRRVGRGVLELSIVALWMMVDTSGAQQYLVPKTNGVPPGTEDSLSLAQK